MRKDILHIPWSELAVVYKGKKQFFINKAILDQQLCWENLEEIKEKHIEKFSVYDEIQKTNDPNLLYLFDKLLREIEFELQDLWKFPKDEMYHMFWQYPKCTCPKLDNIDSYPYMQFFSTTCPLHGD